jgi:hypothetical protein
MQAIVRPTDFEKMSYLANYIYGSNFDADQLSTLVTIEHILGFSIYRKGTWPATAIACYPHDSVTLRTIKEYFPFV